MKMSRVVVSAVSVMAVVAVLFGCGKKEAVQAPAAPAAVSQAAAADQLPKDFNAIMVAGEKYLAEKNFVMAEAAFKKALESIAGNSWALRSLALAYMNQTKMAEAEQALNDAEKSSNGKDPYVFFIRGGYYELKNDKQNAIVQYEKALALEPTHAGFKERLAEVKKK